MGFCICVPSHGYNHHWHHHHHGHGAVLCWGAAPNCKPEHNYELLTKLEGEKEGEGEFKCLICAGTVPVKEGRYHCMECNIDVCKTCFEAPDENKNEDDKEGKKEVNAEKKINEEKDTKIVKEGNTAEKAEAK